MLTELLIKGGIIYENLLKHTMKIRIFHARDIGLKLLLHLFDRTRRNRKIIRRIIRAFLRNPEALNRKLVRTIIHGDIAFDIHIIQHIKLRDARRVRLPDLRINLTGAVLEGNIEILLTILRNRLVLRLHKVSIRHTKPVIKALDVAHAGCLRLLVKKSIHFHI